MNTIVLDKSNPDIANALAGCQSGQTKKMEVEVSVISSDDNVFVGNVTSVTCDAEPASPEGDAMEDAGEKPAMERPYKPAAKKM